VYAFFVRVSRNETEFQNSNLIASETGANFCQTLNKKQVIITTPNSLVAVCLSLSLSSTALAQLLPPLHIADMT